MKPHHPSQAELQDLAELATIICGAPIALCTLTGPGGPTMDAAIGLPAPDIAPAHEFCDHAGPTPLVVTDARLDLRFRHNRLVTGDPGIRLIAALRLIGQDGQPAGALCVMDALPRALTEAQQRGLVLLESLFRVRLAGPVQSGAAPALRRELARARDLEAFYLQQQTFLNNTPNLVYLKSADLRYVFYNTRFAEHFGIGMNAWLGRRDQDVLPANVAAQLRQDEELALQSTGPIDLTREVMDKEGATRVMKYLRFAYTDDGGQRMLGAVAVEITAESEQRIALATANVMLEKLATTDGLTGLTNRRAFDKALAGEWRRARRAQTCLSLLLFDIDHFKSLNDSQGHLKGDDYLRRVASCLRDNLNRPGDLVARFGGEEFAVLLSDMDCIPEGAAAVAERLREQVAGMALPHAASPFGVVTISGGVVTMLPDGPEPTRILQEADAALYAAKARGRNRICVSDAHAVPKLSTPV
jgi:diguanylate cyclase (GGDEF)-like protein